MPQTKLTLISRTPLDCLFGPLAEVSSAVASMAALAMSCRSFSKLMGGFLTNAAVPAARVAPTLDAGEDGPRASANDFQVRRSMGSHSRLAKKLSAMALSCAPPTRPIDGRTPMSLAALPEVRAVCLGRNGE